jgi:lipooligosaccharide transport system permease protein
MLATPLDVDDIVMGEMVWAGSKSLISAGAIVVVAASLGIVRGAHALFVLPVALLVGTCFAAMALVVTALSKSYEFFLYYVTLVVTPMMLFCGVFFPLQGLPTAVQWVAAFLPLTHAVELIRPLMSGIWPARAALHLFVLLAYGTTSYWAATALVRKRLLA